MILGGVATKIGTATADGEIKVSISEDPIITLANVYIPDPPANKKDNSAEAARLARERAVADARKEILKTIQDGQTINVEQLNLADISGASKTNISLINSDIAKLNSDEKKDISKIEKIILKYEVVAKVSKNERVIFSDLQSVGLIDPNSSHKSAITSALRKASSSQVDTYEEIQNFINALEKKFRDRKAAITDVIARIKALIKS